MDSHAVDSTGVAGAGTLLEREEQERVLAGALAAALEGAGTTVLVVGEAGVGKTVLMGRLTDRASTDFTVLRGRGDELEQDYPYGVLRQLLEPAVRAVADADALWAGPAALARPVFGLDAGQPTPSSPEDAAFGRQQGLYWLCANLADALGPLLLAVDDAHRADELSLRFLRFLGHRVDGLPIVELIATRPAQEIDGRPALADMLDDPLCRHLPVDRLSPEATAQYLRQTWGEASVRLGPVCHELTSGNPLLLRALIAEAQRGGLRAQTARPEDLRMLGSRSIGHRVRRALETAPPGAMGIAQAVSILGDGVDPAEAVAFAGLGPQDAAAGTEALLRLGFLDDDAAGLRFVHPLVRTSVYRLLSPVERQAAHLRAAQALRAQGTSSSEELAAHLAAEPVAGEAWATQALADAAERAFVLGAPETAVRYLRRALQEPPAEVTPRPALVAALARAESSAGDPAALPTYVEAIDLAEGPEARTEISLHYAGALSMAGQTSRGMAVLREVLRDQPGAPSPAMRSALHAAALFASSPEALAYRRDEAARIDPTGAAENDPTWPLLATTHAIELAVRGRPATEVAAVIGPAAGALEGLFDLSTGPQWGYGVWALILSERFEQAHDVADRGVELGRRTGSVSVLGLALCLRAGVRLRQGDLRNAEADALESLGLSEYPSWRFGAAACTQFLVQILLEQGRLTEAGQAMAALTEEDREREALSVDATVEYAHALLRLRSRDHAGALSQAEALGRRLGDAEFDGGGFVPWRLVAVRAAAALGEHERAAALASQEVDAARRVGAPGGLADALLCAAEVASGQDHHALIDEAVALAEGSAVPLTHAKALLAAGRSLRIAGQRTEARELLHEAVGLATASGAGATVDAALEELAASGGRPRRRDEDGASLLTASETRVARLAAEGASNREIAQSLFVTQKTVEMHLSSAYRKLDIRSRAQLATRLGA